MTAGTRLQIVGAALGLAGLGVAVAIGRRPEAELLALVAGVVLASLVLLPWWSRAAASADSPAPLPAPDRGTRELLDAIDQPMLIVRGRRVEAANEAARAMLGRHVDGADVRLAIRHPAAVERLIQQSGRGEAGSTDRIELLGLGERDRRWEMITTQLSDGALLVRLADRSGIHASEQMRVDFVANASHELRTPLATLLGFSETLLDAKAADDPATRNRFLGIMFEEARRMQQLVDDLISLSRIEAERFSAPGESVDLLPLVDEVRTSCARLVDEKASAIVVERGAVEPIVLGDRPQLLQMLRNLIVNALKYGRKGEPVTVRFEDAGSEMVRMSIVDRGEGISPEHLPRLTERFYRVDPGRSRAMGGTGLGLAIVKHIVGRHRGRLEIASTPGEGTAVHVFLPLAQLMSSKSHDSVTEADGQPS